MILHFDFFFNDITDREVNVLGVFFFDLWVKQERRIKYEIGFYDEQLFLFFFLEKRQQLIEIGIQVLVLVLKLAFFVFLTLLFSKC